MSAATALLNVVRACCLMRSTARSASSILTPASRYRIAMQNLYNTAMMHGVMRSLAVFLACSAMFAEVPSAVAIRNARLVTVSSGIVEKGTIVVRDGLIEGVGASVTVPGDAWVIDGTGLTVYPGLIDGLSTWGILDAVPAPRGSAPATP